MKLSIKIKETKDKLNTMHEIVAKLNSFVSDFFSHNGDDLLAKNCANVKKHNKLIIFLALFTDQNYDEYGCFTSFNEEGTAFRSIKPAVQEKLLKILDNISNVEEIQFSVED